MIADPKVVGRNVEKLRRLYGETQSQLGSAVGLYNTAVSLIEQGKRCNPDTIALIAKHYGVPAEMMYDGSIDLARIFDAKHLMEAGSLVAGELIRFFPGESHKESDFHKAYEECITLTKDAAKPGVFGEVLNRVMSCVQVFLDGEEDYPAEANANAASCLTLLMMIAEDPDTALLNDAVRANPAISDEDYARLLLAANDLKSREGRPIQCYLIETFYNDVMGCLVDLRQIPSWSDYADRYAALLYLANLTDLDLGREESTVAGFAMLYAQASLGNDLSRHFLVKLLELYEKD